MTRVGNAGVKIDRLSSPAPGPPERASLEIAYPWPLRFANDAESLETETREWVLKNMLVSPEHARARVDRVQVGLLVAWTFPDVSHEDRRLASDFLAWVFLQDDRLDESSTRHDSGVVASVFRSYLDVVTGRPVSPTEPVNVRALGELVSRFAARGSADWLARFRASLEGFWLHGVVVETAHRERKTVPTREQYGRMRSQSIGVLQVLDLAELFRGDPLGQSVHEDDVYRALRFVASRIIAYANDIYSYEKERRAGDPNNLVHVLVHHDRMTVADALEEVLRSHDEELLAFDALAGDLLARHPDDHRAVTDWIGDLRQWIAGALEWTMRSARYESGRELVLTARSAMPTPVSVRRPRDRSRRISGTMPLSPVFRPQARPERRRTLADAIDFPFSDLDAILDSGGLTPDAAEKLVENVVGIHALPFALCLNLCIDGEDVVAPMVIEEPSVVAAASYAARIVRDAGGFTADVDESIVAAQIHLSGVGDFASANAAVLGARASLLFLANESVPGLVARGGGAVDVVVRDLGDGYVAVHVEVDCRDAMGANLVNTVAENVSARIAELARGTVVMRILSNLADHRRVRMSCRIPPELLAVRDLDGATVRDRIVTASEIAARDPYRAATHNKGIMNGIDAVVIATGNDWRAVEAGAHAYAARGGSYRPLAIWHRDEAGCLVGVLDMPLAVGIVGGASRTHRASKLALEIVGARRAGDLAVRCAAVGLASNLAALRALVTDGIQRGHMALHARSIALAAGARGTEVEATAAALGRASSHATLDAARIALALARVPRGEE